MFAVRAALSQPQKLGEVIEDLVDRDRIDPAMLDSGAEGLGFVTDASSSEPERPAPRSLVEAGYRFCAHEPGIDVVLTGTSSMEHLGENLDSIRMPPLPARTLERLRELFGGLDCVSGN
jgi:hypothetical protein